MLFCLYNHFQQLWGGADRTSISTMNLNQEEGNWYKRGEGDAEKGDHWRGTRKSFSDCAEDQPSLINSVHPCLTVINTILTVIHALRPSSLTHPLQIYCTGLTGPRSHTSWAWVAKRDPTIYIWILLMCALRNWESIDSFFNSRENISKNRKLNVCHKGTH